VRYVLYKFDLSEIDSTKSVVNAVFRWTNQAKGNATIKILQVPNGTWTDKTTLAADIADNDYYNVVAAAAANGVIYETKEDFGSSYTIKTLTADLSGAVSKAIAAGDDYITFAFTTSGTHNFFTNGDANNYNDRPLLTLSLADPSFGVVKAEPAKGGVMNGVNAPIKLTLATTIDNDFATGDYIKLINADDESEADINITANGSSLTLTPASDLAERTDYKVVLVSGFADAFGNVLESDKVITTFASGTALDFYDIKFTADESPIYDEVTEIESYVAGDSVTAVAKFNNNSGTDLDAVMLIAVYGADNSLIAVDVAGGTACAPANTETQYAKTITVPGDAADTYIKAFIWTDLEDIRPICEEAIINQAD